MIFQVVKSLQGQQRYPDRRMLWIKNVYLSLYEITGESNCGPRPFEALQAFGGRVERWKGFGLFFVFVIVSACALRLHFRKLSSASSTDNRILF